MKIKIKNFSILIKWNNYFKCKVEFKVWKPCKHRSIKRFYIYNWSTQSALLYIQYDGCLIQTKI
ncbi:unnamed protein product [Paramecium pentaurelia]|uniref:Uncharacterized protein n=1 Tax=Paramecium pentaurelia TaxID=43138 RepID=A0A8S1YJF4_9CILI|nr:unnamed protein product [Paramecium pentaurelia]